MRILIDIGHPAHVHYFKHLIWNMQQHRHKFLIIARDKEISHQLLNAYQIPYISRGKGKNGLFGKLLYTFKANWIILKRSLSFKPDIYLSFGSPYAAHVSWLLRKPHIAVTDTEHAKLGILAFIPFTGTILTPDVFYNDFKSKHVRFNSYIEYTYLHPKYFQPDVNIKEQLGLRLTDKFVLFRFISWNASHDIGQKGIPDELKKQLINEFLTKGFKVMISAEGDMKPFFEEYRVKIAPEKIHSVLKEASFFIGESGTMATEAAILGTPSIYVNSLNAGVFEDEVKHGILYSFRNSNGVLQKTQELLRTPDLQHMHLQKAKELASKKTDVTSYLIWFVENFPSSKQVAQENMTFQNKFLIQE